MYVNFLFADNSLVISEQSHEINQGANRGNGRDADSTPKKDERINDNGSDKEKVFSFPDAFSPVFGLCCVVIFVFFLKILDAENSKKQGLPLWF